MKRSISLFLLSGLIANKKSCQSKKETPKESQLVKKNIVAKDSISENELGKQADWIELMNKGKEDIN